MRIINILCLFFLFSSTILATKLPYYVPAELFDEIRENKIIYEKNPTNNESIFNLAMSYAYTGQIRKGWGLLKKVDESYAEDVVETYVALQDIDGENWKYPFKAAFGYFFIKEKNKAIQKFEEVLAIDQKNVWAYGFIALIYGEMNQTDKAISYCKKALKIEPNATAIHLLYAEGLRRKGKYFEAMKELMIFGRLESQHLDE